MILKNNYHVKTNGDMSSTETTLAVSAADLNIIRQMDCYLTLSTATGINSAVEIVKLDGQGNLQRGLQGTNKRAWPAETLLYASITAADANRALNPALSLPSPTIFSIDYGSKAGIYSPDFNVYGVGALIVFPVSDYVDEGEQIGVAVSTDGGDLFTKVPLQIGGSVLCITTSGYRYADSYNPYSVFVITKDEDGDTLKMFELQNEVIIGESVFSITNDFGGDEPEFLTFKDQQAIYTQSNFYSLSSFEGVFTIDSPEPFEFEFVRMFDGNLGGSYYGCFAISPDDKVLGVYGKGGGVLVDAPGVAAAMRVSGSSLLLAITHDGNIYNENPEKVKTLELRPNEHAVSMVNSFLPPDDKNLGARPAIAIGTNMRIITLDGNLDIIGEMDTTGDVAGIVFTGTGHIWEQGYGRQVYKSGLSMYRDGYMPGRLLDDIMKRLSALEAQTAP